MKMTFYRQTTQPI